MVDCLSKLAHPVMRYSFHITLVPFPGTSLTDSHFQTVDKKKQTKNCILASSHFDYPQIHINSKWAVLNSERFHAQMVSKTFSSVIAGLLTSLWTANERLEIRRARRS